MTALLRGALPYVGKLRCFVALMRMGGDERVRIVVMGERRRTPLRLTQSLAKRDV